MDLSAVAAELAPHGVLRAGINLSNFLLVSRREPDGTPVGVAPDLARLIADRLGLPVSYAPYPRPGELADAAGSDIWDICLIGAEPARAEKIEFTPAYVEIEATYLVPPNSPLRTLADVDRPGVTIVSTARAAYDLWLDRNTKHANLVRAETIPAAYDLFVTKKADALAGLKPRLLADQANLPGSHLLEGKFHAVQQAIGCLKGRLAAAAFLREFLVEAKRDGTIANLIAQYEVVGLSIAP